MLTKNKLLRYIVGEKIQGIIMDRRRLNKHINNANTIKQIIGDAKTIIDVGAYKGEFSQACLNVFPNATILAFELNEEICKSHLSKIKNNNFMIFQMGLSDKNGTNIFYKNLERGRQSSFLKNTLDYPIKKENVSCLRFDSCVVPINHPSLLKIDAEGYDLNILKGFGERLKEIDLIMCEIIFSEMHENQPKPNEIIEFLKKNGFNKFNFLNANYKNKKISSADVICYRGEN